ncbi:MAG: FAD-dependent oxidoreductase [Candidatus Aenigmatarchaeota archaeon]
MEKIKGKVCGISWHTDRIIHLFVQLEKEVEIPICSFTNFTYKGITRPLSVCNFEPKNILEFVVALKEGGQLSEKLREIKVGDEVELTKPIKTLRTEAKKLLFITGGSGIAAFIPLIRAYEQNILDFEEIVVFHSERNLASCVFFKEFKDYRKTKLFLTFTREQVPNFMHGRLNKEVIESEVDLKEYEIHIAGPKEFVDEISKQLSGLNIKSLRW